MPASGHSPQINSAPAPNDVGYAQKATEFLRISEMTRWVNSADSMMFAIGRFPPDSDH